MNLCTKQWRTLALAAVLVVGSVCWMGCGDDTGANNGGGGNTTGGDNCTSAEKCKQVTIDTQTWMAENLNINTSGSWCYGDSSKYCGMYGRLYTWEAAKSACPTGWRLPDTADWNKLVNYAGGYSTAGKTLKSTSGWYENGNGTDDYGFNALPGGYRRSDGYFDEASVIGVWWTATEFGSGLAYGWWVDYDGDLGYLDEDTKGKANGFSVRCVSE